MIGNHNIEDIYIKWKNKEFSILDYSCYEDFDIAFLKTNEMPADIWIPFLDVQNLKDGTECVSFGYPCDYISSGSPLILKYTGSDINETLLSFSGDNVTPGFSGSPIIDTESGGLVAMLSISRDILTSIGGRGISGKLILKLLCHDIKFSKFALQMLQLNNYNNVEKYHWISNDTDMEYAVSIYLQNIMNQNPNFSKSSDLFVFYPNKPVFGLVLKY